MKSKSMKIMIFLTVMMFTLLFMGMVCATTTDNNMDTSSVGTIHDVTPTNHNKHVTINNVEETSIDTENDDKINEADATTKNIDKNTDKTASKAVSANITYSGEDTDTYEKVKNLIETNDDAQELIIELNKDKTYIITEPITFGTQTNTKTLTINGCNAIIDGNNTQSFIKVQSGYTLNLNTITIQNTKADNGAAIYSYGTVNIFDAIFKDNSAVYQGGAVYSYGTLKANRTQFIDNKVTTTEKAVERDYGGGAILAGGTLFVDNSSFNGNIAEYDSKGTVMDAGIGGAIFILNNTKDVSIINSKFKCNKAGYGGAVTVYDPLYRDEGNIVVDSNVFDKNYAYEGGALNLQHSAIVTNNDFTNNIVYNQINIIRSFGGAIILYDGQSRKTYTLTLSNNRFDANDVGEKGLGGAIFLQSGMILDSRGNLYENNNASYGGAIFSIGEATFTDDIFNNNSALYQGGAVYSYGTLTANRTQFTDNKVTTTKDAAKNDYGGGAILSSGPLSIDNSLFAGNIAAHDDSRFKFDGAIGGAIYIFNCTDDVILTNNNFTENKAICGGAIAVYDPQYRDEGNLLIDSNNFIENTANQGGTIALQHSTIINNNNFTDNGINEKNINIFPFGAAIDFYDEKHEKTYTLTLSDNTFNGNDAGERGVAGTIHISIGMVLNSKNNTYKNNKASIGGAILNEGKATLTGDTFTNNTALYKGGAIYSYGTLTVNRSKFNNNKVTTSKNATAKDYGGGAILAKGPLSIDNSTFNGNIAEYDTTATIWDAGIGGAIFIYNNTDDISITNSRFTDNEAGYGGAIKIYDAQHRDEGNIVIDSNVFNKNHAYEGGALNLQPSAIVTNNDFTENILNQNIDYPSMGAAILIYDEYYKTHTLTLSDNRFHANDAGKEGMGGAVLVSENMILNSTGNIYENNKALYGGAIANMGDATSADDIFTENTAVYRGGAIYSEGRMDVNSSQFIDNKVTTSKNAAKEDNGGGAIFTGSTLTVDNSLFRGNVATHDNIESEYDGGPAGAIYIFNNTDAVIITNSNFTENNAAIGGVVNIYDPLYRNEGKILIDNNIFSENYAIHGGAISTLQPVNITNNKFIKNYVYYDENYHKPTSGTILLYNFNETEFTVNVFNNTFSENSADMGDSGAISVSNKVLLNSNNNVYENNKAFEGGVMFNNASATFTNDIFTGNTATFGGVFANWGNLTLINCTFKDNTAKEYGDLAYTLNDMTISDSTINTDNLERLIRAYAKIFASNNTVNEVFLEEELINSTLTLERRDLVLNKENSISGTLIDATNVPIVNVTVYLYVDGRYDSSAVTDENGAFTFKYTPTNGTNATLTALFYPSNYYLTSYSDSVEVQIVDNDTNNTPQPKPVPKVKPTTTKTAKNAKKITQANTHTIRLASDNTLIYTGNTLTLEALNKIFSQNFTNGHLLVYIDGVLVFNETTTDDITTVILELLDKYLGEHEIKVVFTDSQNQTDTYKENIKIGQN